MRRPVPVCDEVVGISGFCCPIGTACFTHGSNNVVECVDALGTTASSFPSATTGLIPSATPVLSSDIAIVYDPPQAWNVSDTEVNCTTSKSWHITDSVNATISYNYTGPSIMVHTGTSSIGGAFWVLADGFNTTSTIDTYSGPGNLTLPVCYPIQFPPFAVTPPGYESRMNHTLTLVFSGPSSDTPSGTNGSNFLFNGFAIPDLQFSLGATNDGSSEKQHIYFYLAYFVVFSTFFLL
ncbi:hypothetical protein GALMADRAFT_159047 [Galerina marginata CBS 339.88]|uniref:Uncharacterized protein n=1 Tax=Galerina marginata (strain CBS 339.88) TaxID=685588 RepID=A0A067T020_GALM3|nr:hypothetical protein GALMADRAFT_159047 [Galerina marginata CBS 339.88]